MPFLPFVLLLAWQAISKSASFALGWATSIYFGQIPGSKGRMLAVVSLVSAGWVILVVGFGLPLLVGAALDAADMIERNFDVETRTYLALAAAIVLTPPVMVAGTVIVGFHEARSVVQWLRRVPMSYPATFSLGVAVLMMVALTPVLLIQRWREKRALVQVPLVLREEADDDELVEIVGAALRTIGIERVERDSVRGVRRWPLLAAGFAARHLVGAVVRGEPMVVRVDGLELYAYATNVAISGPKKDAYRARAAIERELALRDAYVTWSEDSQRFEDELKAIHRGANGDGRTAMRKLDELQERIDAAAINGEEWNRLYRIRLQVEKEAARSDR